MLRPTAASESESVPFCLNVLSVCFRCMLANHVLHYTPSAAAWGYERIFHISSLLNVSDLLVFKIIFTNCFEFYLTWELSRLAAPTFMTVAVLRAGSSPLYAHDINTRPTVTLNITVGEVQVKLSVLMVGSCSACFPSWTSTTTPEPPPCVTHIIPSFFKFALVCFLLPSPTLLCGCPCPLTISQAPLPL